MAIDDIKVPGEAPVAESHPSGEACDTADVIRRTRAGFVTIAVAAVVAITTLAAAAGGLLVSGFIPLSGLEGRISSAIEERLGKSWSVKVESAEISREDGRSRLRARQVVFRHSGGAMIRAPEAILGYAPLALLRGDIRLVSIDLRGVNVRLGVDRNGALLVDADSAPVAFPERAPPPEPAALSAFGGIMAAVGTLAEGDGLLGALETAGMRGARLALVDPDGRLRAGLEDVDISLSRLDQGVTRLAMKGRTGQRWKEFAIDLSTAADGTRRAEVDIRRFEPAELVELMYGDGAVALDGLPLSGRVLMEQSRSGQQRLEGDLALAPGTIRFLGGPFGTVPVQHARLALSSTDGLKTIAVSAGELAMGDTKLAVSGDLVQEGAAWRLSLQGKGQLAGRGHDAPLQIENARTELSLDPAAGEVRIPVLALRGPAITADIALAIRSAGGSLWQKVDVRAVDSEARALLAAWPAFTSADLHRMLTERLEAGRFRRLDVHVDLPAEGHRQLVNGGGTPDEAVKVHLEADDVRFQIGAGLPALTQVSVSGDTTGRTVNLAIDKGQAELGGGRSLALAEGSFVMPDTYTHRTPARIGFRATGGADALAALFNFPALKDFAPVKVDPASLRGNVDLKTMISTPLVDRLQPGELVVQATGMLAGIGSDSLLGNEKLDGANLALQFDRGNLTMKGEGRVGGDKSAIEIRQNAKGQGEATLAMTLDAAARQRRGIGPEAGITGPVQVKVSKPLGKTPEAPPRVEADLTRAAIDADIPGLSKPAGRAGRLAFNYIADPDGPDFEDLVFENASALVKGKLSLTKQNGFESASFSQVKLSPGDNLKLDIARDGAVTKLVVRGAVADARPFIKDLVGSSAGSSAGRGQARTASGGDYDLDLNVPILTGFNNEAVGNAVLKLSKRGGAVRSLSFDGRVGRYPVTIRQDRAGEGAGPLVLQTDNGGSVLRFLDLYRRAYGGNLVLQLGPGENRQAGELLFRDFMVRDEPALRRVASAQNSAAAPDRSAGAGAAPPAVQIDASEVAFTKLRAEFVRSASRLDVSDAVIWGQQVGFTAQGSIDYGRDRVDIGGTFVPGYAFNNAFAQVPVLGALLGGGSQYGGLFAVNFRISGAASQPSMSINPLSAIAPGILRRFVDPLGGTPIERPRGSARPAEPEAGR